MPSPLARESDEEKPAAEKKPDEKPREKPHRTRQKPEPVTIDFEGIDDRILDLPTGGATLRDLQAGKSGELYYLRTPARRRSTR